jgi:hypothetical protein
MRILIKTKEGYMKWGTRDGSPLGALCSTHRVELRHWFLGIILLEIKGQTLPSKSWACWLTFLVTQPHRVDQRSSQVGLVPTCSERGARQPGWRIAHDAWHASHDPERGSQKAIASCHFGFPYSISSGAWGIGHLTLLFQSSAGQSGIVFPCL